MSGDADEKSSRWSSARFCCERRGVNDHACTGRGRGFTIINRHARSSNASGGSTIEAAQFRLRRSPLGRVGERLHRRGHRLLQAGEGDAALDGDVDVVADGGVEDVDRHGVVVLVQLVRVVPRALVEDERAAADEDVDRVVDLLERVAEDAAGAPAERGAEKAVRRGRDGRELSAAPSFEDGRRCTSSSWRAGTPSRSPSRSSPCSWRRASPGRAASACC